MRGLCHVDKPELLVPISAYYCWLWWLRNDVLDVELIAASSYDAAASSYALVSSVTVASPSSAHTVFPLH